MTLRWKRNWITKVIGSCSINFTVPADKEAMTGYVLNRNYWNQGYVTEALRAVVAFGFEQLGLHRIIASCDPKYRFHTRDGKSRHAAEGYLRKKKCSKASGAISFCIPFWKKEWRNSKVDHNPKKRQRK